VVESFAGYIFNGPGSLAMFAATQAVISQPRGDAGNVL
jgi:hypothetical protein